MSRAVAEVAVPVTVFDAESNGVDLAVEVDWGEGRVPALLAAPATGLSTTPGGELHTLTWLAAEQRQASSYLSTAQLFVTPRDASASGPTAQSAFAVGNDAPTGTLSVDDETVSGLAVLRLTVTDTAGDLVRVGAFELTLAGDFSDAIEVPLEPGQGTHFPSGALSSLASEGGVEHSFVWSSLLSATADHEDARVRLRLIDAHGGDSGWIESEVFDIDNGNTAPGISIVTAPPSIGGTSIAVTYAITDVDGDACAVRIDYSFDQQAWTAASTASVVSGLTPGQYTVAWASSELPQALYDEVYLRLTVTDARGASGSVTTAAFTVDTRVSGPPTARLDSVAADVSGRPLDVVQLVYSLSNPGADPVDVLVEYSVDGLLWHEATALSGDGVLGIDTSAGLVQRTTIWDAFAEAQPPGPSVLAPIQLDTDGDEVGDDDVVAGTPAVRLRITPSDQDGEGLETASPPFVLGNDPPEAALLPITGQQAGNIPIAFTVEDALFDTVRVELRFREHAADAWRLASIGIGQLTDLVTVSGPRTYVVVWDSRALSDANPDTPQGIGVRNLTTVELRIRAIDSPQAGVEHHGAWSPQLAGLDLHNFNEAPTLGLGAMPPSPVEGSATFTYTLTDVEADSCTLVVEAWDGVEWLQAMGGAGGDGVIALSSSPAGESHTFVWNATQLGFEEYLDVKLRFTAYDGGDGTPISVETAELDVNNRNVVNAAPAASLGAVQSSPRLLALVDVPYTLSDANGPPGGADTVDVRLFYSLDGVDFTSEATPDAAFAVTGLAAAPGGSPFTLRWDAPADLATHALDTDGDEAGDTLVLVGQPSVYVRMQPVDSQALPGATTDAISFSLGNDPPSGTITGVAGTSDISIAFQLEDSQSDPSRIELEFRRDDTDPWRVADIALGATSGLATSPGGNTNIVVWASATVPNELDDRDPQGVGPYDLSTIDLRLRAIDDVGGTEFYGPWFYFGTEVTVDNQSAPRVEVVYVKNDADLRTGRIPITYRIIDAESDDTAVHIEVSTDGVYWSRATEHPSPISEGTLGLPSAPEGDTSGKNVHTFVWDAAADLFQHSTSVRLRMTAADAFGAGASQIILPESSVGPPQAAPNDSPFSPVARYAADFIPARIETADFDGDGVLDLAVPTSSTHELFIYLGDGDGTFTSLGGFAVETESAAATGPVSAAIADFDEDGILDFAVAGSAGVVRVRLGTGAAGVWDLDFAPTASHALGAEAHVIRAGDVDGDGVLDLVVAVGNGFADAALKVLLGEGTDGAETGTFASPVTHALPSEPRDLVLADVDADSRLDAVVGRSTCIAWGQTGGAAGTFPSCTAVPMGIGRVQVGDMNGDGALDLVSACSNSLCTTLADPGTPRGFAPRIDVAQPAAVAALALGDMNGDGVLDAVFGPASDADDVFIAFGETDNARASGAVAVGLGITNGALENPADVALGDFDGDGYLDVATAEQVQGDNLVHDVAVLLADERPLASPATFAAKRSYETRYLRALADIDEDGALDVVGFDGFASVQLLQGGRAGNAPTGSFGVPTLLPAGSVFDVADLDADGRVDLLLGAGGLHVAFGNGEAGGFDAFDDPVTLDAFNVWGLRAGEMTGDAHTDIAAYSNTEIRIFAGAGDRTVTQVFAAAMADAPEPSTQLGDFNTDGALDFAVPTLGGAYVVLSNGAGGFTGPTVYGGGQARTIAACDLTGDDILDLAVGQGSTVAILPGNGSSGDGDGTFDDVTPIVLTWDPLESTCRHASLSIL